MSEKCESEGSCSDTARHSATPALAVVLEGGLVQAIVTNRPDDISVDTLIIDYDTEGADDDEISLVPQSDGSYAEALVRSEPIATAQIDIDRIVDKPIADE